MIPYHNDPIPSLTNSSDIFVKDSDESVSQHSDLIFWKD